MEDINHNHIESKEVTKNLSFDRDKATLLLDITLESLPFDSLRKLIEKEGLFQKNEFHITIIGSESGEVILEKISELSLEEQDKLLSRIENLSKSFDWYYNFLPDYYFISKDYREEGSEAVETRKSIIQVLELPDLKLFYEQLNDLLGTEFSIPFAHVTLYTTSTNKETKLRGIGIYSAEQLQTLNPVKIEVDRDA